MAIPAVDAESSFQYLLDHIPTWIETLQGLTQHASVKHNEFVADYAKAIKSFSPKHRKTNSITSIHSDDEELVGLPAGPDSTDPHTDLGDINPLEAGNRYLFAQARRKRKPGSSLKSGASGPQKFRSKQSVIIYYDSHLQQELDAMVKSVGIARNNLRKGKLSLTVSKGFQLPEVGRRRPASLTPPSIESLRRAGLKSYIPSGGKPSLTLEVKPPSDEAAFTKADNELDQMQTLCEKAAHQFLRDGDCSIELTCAASKLQSVLDLAKETLPRLQPQADSPTSLSPITPSQSNVETPTLPFPDFTLSGVSKAPTIQDTIAEMNARPMAPAVSTVSAPAVIDIEVDNDSDQESIEVDITKFRMATRAGRAVRAQ